MIFFISEIFVYVNLKNMMEQILIASTNMSPFKIASRRCCVYGKGLVIEKVAVFGCLFTLI